MPLVSHASPFQYLEKKIQQHCFQSIFWRTFGWFFSITWWFSWFSWKCHYATHFVDEIFSAGTFSEKSSRWTCQWRWHRWRFIPFSCLLSPFNHSLTQWLYNAIQCTKNQNQAADCHGCRADCAGSSSIRAAGCKEFWKTYLPCFGCLWMSTVLFKLNEITKYSCQVIQSRTSRIVGKFRKTIYEKCLCCQICPEIKVSMDQTVRFIE